MRWLGKVCYEFESFFDYTIKLLKRLTFGKGKRDGVSTGNDFIDTLQCSQEGLALMDVTPLKGILRLVSEIFV
jgi:hypothetical protein